MLRLWLGLRSVYSNTTQLNSSTPLDVELSWVASAKCL